ncbi:MAG: FAD-dependent oxidoreductase [Alphaproteobacteria bacterium]|nr:FAD-dependent oxidoreductase [Alphaproteobacteria bacterium]
MAAGLTAGLPLPAFARGAAGQVVVVGGGFGGATCARAVKRLEPGLTVTLVEADPAATYTACPFSNEVIAGARGLGEQQFRYDKLAADDIAVCFLPALAVDPQHQVVTVADGRKFPYDRLVLAPGIDFRGGDLPGYSEAAATLMPHAWKAGPQTLLLRRQLQAMPEGGTVVITAPENPYRCPPGPYERASLIAHFLKTNKPRAKLLLLDAKDTFSKQKLFQNAWAALYPGLIEWVSLSQGGKVTAVDAQAMTLATDFATHKADVANVIPSQKAGGIAAIAGVADKTGWCPIDPVTFASTLQPNIHVIGDAAVAGAMPKSAFAANAQAKVCAAAIVASLAGDPAPTAKLINTCYSLVAPDYGISVAGVYHAADGKLLDVEGAGGTSPIDAPPERRAAEAAEAKAWFRAITAEVFG